MPPRSPRKRVSNEVGLVLHADAGQVVALLVARGPLRDLASCSESLWGAARHEAVHVVLGVLVMRRVDADRYEVDTASAAEGYGHMLREVASGLAAADGVVKVGYLGQHLRPRRWSPLSGVLRRGRTALRAVARGRALDDRGVEGLLDTLRRGFLNRVTEEPPTASESQVNTSSGLD